MICTSGRPNIYRASPFEFDSTATTLRDQSEPLEKTLQDQGIPPEDAPLLCAHCLLDRGRLEDQRRPAELRLQIFCHQCSTWDARTPILSAKVCGIHAQIVLDTWNMNGRFRSPGGYALELSRLDQADDSITVDQGSPDHSLLDRIFDHGEVSE